MKKKFIALLLVVSSIAVSTNLTSANEVNLIKEETVVEKENKEPVIVLRRESDWGEENYGNWKEIAKHPENYKKVTACMLKKNGTFGNRLFCSRSVRNVSYRFSNILFRN